MDDSGAVSTVGVADIVQGEEYRRRYRIEDQIRNISAEDVQIQGSRRKTIEEGRSVKRYKCSVCWYSSSRRYNVVRHEYRIHLTPKFHQCCGTDFETKGEYYLHCAESHPNSRDFPSGRYKFLLSRQTPPYMLQNHPKLEGIEAQETKTSESTALRPKSLKTYDESNIENIPLIYLKNGKKLRDQLTVNGSPAVTAIENRPKIEEIRSDGKRRTTVSDSPAATAIEKQPKIEEIRSDGKRRATASDSPAATAIENRPKIEEIRSDQKRRTIRENIPPPSLPLSRSPLKQVQNIIATTVNLPMSREERAGRGGILFDSTPSSSPRSSKLPLKKRRILESPSVKIHRDNPGSCPKLERHEVPQIRSNEREISDDPRICTWNGNADRLGIFVDSPFLPNVSSAAGSTLSPRRVHIVIDPAIACHEITQLQRDYLSRIDFNSF